MGPQDGIMLAYALTQLSGQIMDQIRLSGEMTEEEIKAAWAAQKDKLGHSIDLWNTAKA